MADRDNYRGYGSPSGRYYENREYGSSGGDRNRYRGGRDDDRNRMGGREDWRGDEDRGFFEKAGEEIRSWFSDDDDRDRGRQHDRERGYGWGSMMSGRGRDHREDHPQTMRAEPWGGGDRGGQQRQGSDNNESGGSRYGATSGAGMGSRANQYGGGRDMGDHGRRGSHPHDEHYSEWRNRQLAELDRDYDEYRRENRDKFHNEFTSWRGQRQQQRASVRQVREHMEVVGSDGESVGTVDKVSGDRIILTKSGAMAGGHHHSIPCSWLQSVDDKVTINKTAEQARNQWRDEENRRALFESEDQRRNDGPHILDRSFSGTYER